MESQYYPAEMLGSLEEPTVRDRVLQIAGVRSVAVDYDIWPTDITIR